MFLTVGVVGKRSRYSPLAQSVEHAAVNRGVVGSSPTRGARKEEIIRQDGLFVFAVFAYWIEPRKIEGKAGSEKRLSGCHSYDEGKAIPILLGVACDSTCETRQGEACGKVRSKREK